MHVQRSAGVLLNSKRASMAPFKADMVLFIHDNYTTLYANDSDTVVSNAETQYKINDKYWHG
jgi:hypothetical protein